MESLSVFFFQKRGIHLSFDIDVLDPTVAPATGSHISPRHYPLIPLIFLFSSVKVFLYFKINYLMRLYVPAMRIQMQGQENLSIFSK